MTATSKPRDPQGAPELPKTWNPIAAQMHLRDAHIDEIRRRRLVALVEADRISLRLKALP